MNTLWNAAMTSACDIIPVPEAMITLQDPDVTVHNISARADLHHSMLLPGQNLSLSKLALSAVQWIAPNSETSFPQETILVGVRNYLGGANRKTKEFGNCGAMASPLYPSKPCVQLRFCLQNDIFVVQVNSDGILDLSGARDFYTIVVLMLITGTIAERCQQTQEVVLHNLLPISPMISSISAYWRHPLWCTGDSLSDLMAQMSADPFGSVIHQPITVVHDQVIIRFHSDFLPFESQQPLSYIQELKIRVREGGYVMLTIDKPVLIYNIKSTQTIAQIVQWLQAVYKYPQPLPISLVLVIQHLHLLW